MKHLYRLSRSLVLGGITLAGVSAPGGLAGCTADAEDEIEFAANCGIELVDAENLGDGVYRVRVRNASDLDGDITLTAEYYNGEVRYGDVATSRAPRATSGEELLLTTSGGPGNVATDCVQFFVAFDPVGRGDVCGSRPLDEACY